MKPPSPHSPKLTPDAAQREALQRQQARAFLSVNLLARGIAHDFSNVMAGILGSAELLKLDCPPALANHPSLAEIFRAGARANEMIRLLNSFSQRNACQRTIISLVPVLEASLKIIRDQLPAGVELSHHLAKETPAVWVDAAQIQQVVISLCLGAAHSLPAENGRIEVSLTSCQVDASLAAKLSLCHGPHVRLSVHDNGGHFTKRMLERIFEPFACKRPTGQNRGLELFAAREIIHAHEGEITVASVPGEGTGFQIYLPAPPLRP